VPPRNDVAIQISWGKGWRLRRQPLPLFKSQHRHCEEGGTPTEAISNLFTYGRNSLY